MKIPTAKEIREKEARIKKEKEEQRCLALEAEELEKAKPLEERYPDILHGILERAVLAIEEVVVPKIINAVSDHQESCSIFLFREKKSNPFYRFLHSASEEKGAEEVEFLKRNNPIKYWSIPSFNYNWHRITGNEDRLKVFFVCLVIEKLRFNGYKVYMEDGLKRWLWENNPDRYTYHLEGCYLTVRWHVTS